MKKRSKREKPPLAVADESVADGLHEKTGTSSLVPSGPTELLDDSPPLPVTGHRSGLKQKGGAPGFDVQSPLMVLCELPDDSPPVPIGQHAHSTGKEHPKPGPANVLSGQPTLLAESASPVPISSHPVSSKTKANKSQINEQVSIPAYNNREGMINQSREMTLGTSSGDGEIAPRPLGQSIPNHDIEIAEAYLVEEEQQAVDMQHADVQVANPNISSALVGNEQVAVNVQVAEPIASPDTLRDSNTFTVSFARRKVYIIICMFLFAAIIIMAIALGFALNTKNYATTEELSAREDPNPTTIVTTTTSSSPQPATHDFTATEASIINSATASAKNSILNQETTTEEDITSTTTSLPTTEDSETSTHVGTTVTDATCLIHNDCEIGVCGYDSFSEDASKVCCSSGGSTSIMTTDFQYRDFCTGLPQGTACGNYDDLCESNACVLQTCQGTKLSSNVECSIHNDCEMGACGYDSFSEDASLVCCSSGGSTSIMLSDFQYRDFCTGLQLGVACGEYDDLCESNACVLQKCSSGKIPSN